MKKITALILTAVFSLSMLYGCNADSAVTENKESTVTQEPFIGTQVVLSDSEIEIDGKPAVSDTTQAVYIASDIVYYESGHDFRYGEGTDADAHSKEKADAHTVVHITQPGQYVISGKLSKGQIAVDLGDEAEKDPGAVVTLVLNNAEITCEVAPAVIFYNVYECGTKDAETATKDVDTSPAGANVIIADNSENTVTGSYVARIYKPDSVVLSDNGTEVEDAKKLHKYDGAFYSKMSMNVGGGKLGNGVLNINAANEGLDSELHLTINGGNINIISGNDGINTNEDNISVTTVNAGNLNILVNGKTGEGDGIDSNGWLVINGGSVTTQACAFSGDAGIDSDMGIHINGGKVFATGNMLDRISESAVNFAVFSFAETQKSGVYSLKNSQGETVAEKEIANSFSYLIISDELLAEGDYALYSGNKQLQVISSQGMNGHGGRNPMSERPEMPEEMTMPERPEGMTPPEMPEGMSRPEKPEDMTFPEGEMQGGMHKPDGDFEPNITGEVSSVFSVRNGENYFTIAK